MGELIEKLGINPLLLGGQIVNFILLLLILQRFLYKPLVTLLDKRSAKIAASLKKAEEIEHNAQQAQADFDKKLAAAQAEGAQLIAEAKQAAERLHADLMAKAEQQARDIIDKGAQSVAAERVALRAELRQETARLVIAATEQILAEELTPEKKQAYTNRVLEKIS